MFKPRQPGEFDFEAHCGLKPEQSHYCSFYKQKMTATERFNKMQSTMAYQEMEYAIKHNVMEDEIATCDDCGEKVIKEMCDVWCDTLVICLKCKCS